MFLKNALKLNWKRAAAELALIVVGVSIALTADSWLAARVEKARVDQLLDSLEVEWTAELKRIDVSLNQWSHATADMIRVINASEGNPPSLTATEAASLVQQSYEWRTFKPSDGALNTLLADGVQNIEDPSLRLAVASWQSVLGELVAEQAALRALGAVDEPRISTKIAQNSGKAFPNELNEYLNSMYGMEAGAFALAAIADEEWVAIQRQTLDMLIRYQSDLISVRETLKINLVLLHDRKTN